MDFPIYDLNTFKMWAIATRLGTVIPEHWNFASAILLQYFTTLIREDIPTATCVVTDVVNRFIGADPLRLHVFTAGSVKTVLDVCWQSYNGYR